MRLRRELFIAVKAVLLMNEQMHWKFRRKMREKSSKVSCLSFWKTAIWAKFKNCSKVNRNSLQSNPRLIMKNGNIRENEKLREDQIRVQAINKNSYSVKLTWALKEALNCLRIAKTTQRVFECWSNRCSSLQQSFD